MIVPFGFYSRMLGRRLSKCPEGDPPASGGGGGGGAPDPKPNPDPKPETVSREFADRLLSEKKAEQAKREAAEAELKKYRDKEAEAELARRKAAGDFEALEKGWMEKLAEKDKKLSEYDAMIANVRKMQSFRKTVGAEIPEKYADLVQLDRIELGPDGMPIESSVVKYAAEFRKTYGEILGTPKKLPPDDGAVGTEGKLTYAEWKKLPYAEQKKRMSEVKDYPM